jgi:nitrite reductase/ring-hydroxylating ferredoxin subunit/uncharacterized membrane protein
VPTISAPTGLAEQLRARIDQIGKVEALDKVGDQVDKALRPLFDDTKVKNALSGVWLGHRLHPMLTDVVLGSFTSATLIDYLAPRHRVAARRLIAVGIVAAVPTIASGWSDWVDVYEDGRRIGLVHSTANAVGVSLFARSWLRRGKRSRGGGRISALAGLAVMSVGGYLGGHLSYVQGVGVDHTAFQPKIEEWTDVVASVDVPEGGNATATVNEVEILVVRHDGRLSALANRCSHAGQPLGEGKIEGACVTCPAHGSTFQLDDGSVVRGPAASPQPVFDVRETNGRIEVRSR